jgi:hypothetical protein
MASRAAVAFVAAAAAAAAADLQHTDDGQKDRVKEVRNEWNSQQRQVFTAWCNSRLQAADSHIDDIEKAFSDGRLLLTLLEIITGEPMPKPEAGRLRLHKIANVGKALQVLKDKCAQQVSVSAEDIVDGNLKMILGLMWTLVLRFDMNDIVVDGERPSRSDNSPKILLLLWCKKRTENYTPLVCIENFDSSFNDGRALCAIIHSYRPDLIDFDQLDKNSREENVRLALRTIETDLGIPHMMDAEDLLADKPDEKCVMTLMSALYRRLTQKKQTVVIHKVDSVSAMTAKKISETSAASCTSSSSDSDGDDDSANEEISKSGVVDAALMATVTTPRETSAFVNEAFESSDDESPDDKTSSVDDPTAVTASTLSPPDKSVEIDCDFTDKELAYDGLQRQSVTVLPPAARQQIDERHLDDITFTLPPVGEHDEDDDDDDLVCCCCCCGERCLWLRRCACFRSVARLQFLRCCFRHAK